MLINVKTSALLQPDNPIGQEIMAEIQDEIDLDVGEIEAVEAEQIKEVKPETVTPELPEKYRGKSIEDIVKMHQESEKIAGKNAQEADEVRKLADELIKSQLRSKPEEDKPVEVDFFENPQEAIRQAVNNNPKVLAAEHAGLIAQMEMAKAKVAQLHPDFPSVVKEDGFKDWINASKIRSQLYAQAENYNVDAADELLSTYKELKAVKQKRDIDQIQEIDTISRNKSLNAAAVDTGGSGESHKKVYRRADIMRLMTKDPARYEAMADDIYAAYAEGRVR